MRIEKLAGTSPRLYELVAPLVMDPVVLKQNNNYPFKTSERFTWFVCLDDEGKVVGFMPVEERRESVVINNYHSGGDVAVLKGLVKSTWKCFGKEKPVVAIVQSQDEGVFGKERFHVVREWKLYKKMEKVHGKAKTERLRGKSTEAEEDI